MTQTVILRGRGAREKTCGQCGAVFQKDPRYSWAYFAKQKYCSQDCAGLAWSIERIQSRPDIHTAFEKWFERGDGCWEWVGATDKEGYAIFSYAGQQYRASRLVLKWSGVELNSELFACHHCDNPSCVRPDHLFAGTHKDNMRDMAAKGRHGKARV